VCVIIPALDFIESKTGHTFNRETNEKITDGVRDFYEKQTGYVISLAPFPHFLPFLLSFSFHLF
jgi:hypothetical protein